MTHPLLTPPPEVPLREAVLRAWTAADAPALHRALAGSEPHLRRWTPWVVDGRVPGQSLEERLDAHASAFARGAEWVYGIFPLDGSEVLGGCGLYPRIGPGAVEIGYWLAAPATGRGLATQAAAALVQVAFASPDIARVEMRCDPRNVASARVPERLGFRIDEAASLAAGLQVWSGSRETYRAPATTS